MWMGAILAGLLTPLAVVVLTNELALGTAFHVAGAVTTLALVDVPLVRAGISGRGAPGVVQPWRWSMYSFWLAVRLAIVVPAAALS